MSRNATTWLRVDKIETKTGKSVVNKSRQHINNENRTHTDTHTHTQGNQTNVRDNRNVARNQQAARN